MGDDVKWWKLEMWRSFMDDAKNEFWLIALVNAIRKWFCDHDYVAVIMVNDGDGFIKCEKCDKMLYFYDYYKSEDVVSTEVVCKKGG
jgi:hypothetical protein